MTSLSKNVKFQICLAKRPKNYELGQFNRQILQKKSKIRK